ncbi:MAG: hydrolase [Ectothiorhodospiraceae bacterium]|nr:hydrolase [Ectothiorhodospiraceae bacterium]MCH8505701.1 hydrolase [Ectothiorhodospiraceae bacterium]
MIHTGQFTPPGWLRSGHAQTLWPALLRRAPPLQLREELLELPDGDCLRLAWGPAAPGPLVVILHGLGGHARSAYVLGLIAALHRDGMEAVVMQFRGAGGVPNRLDRFFHAGETDDLECTVAHVQEQRPDKPLALVGFSMGGIVGLNWLGDNPEARGLSAAVAVSAPLHLARCARHLDQGFSRLYQWDLVRNLKRLVRTKHAHRPLQFDISALQRIRTLWDFDDRLTGPMHGFESAEDYYGRCAPVNRLGNIRVPTLILLARDDPFIPPHSLPDAALIPEAVRFELNPGGGHVGFVTGTPLKPRYWAEERILQHLRAHI